ncbi:winged helix-turn-helix domain-containing protein [Arthrobacter dokdonensis]|uniref:winged helix-turn-helix domain-containing protein n=1 Tax=Arthrobacter dokdonellae TaxID=2211210 RepID=UPI001D132183|nr:winged helix-turn-helix domain-containing protein [Arthrobacter dokdonellae]
MNTVLVVDDEPQILRALQINLHAHGYQVVTAPTGAAALQAAQTHAIDVVVLDLGLPDMDGLDVIAGLRGWTRCRSLCFRRGTAPLTWWRRSTPVRDDYVTKPFGLDELLARLRAASRRAGPQAAEPMVSTAEFTVDLANKLVLRKGAPVRMTPTEWKVLELLVRNPGRLVSQQQMLSEVWGPAYAKETHYLRVYMAQLRRKLERDPANPEHLLTEAGMGYRFQP